MSRPSLYIYESSTFEQSGGKVAQIEHGGSHKLAFALIACWCESAVSEVRCEDRASAVLTTSLNTQTHFNILTEISDKTKHWRFFRSKKSQFSHLQDGSLSRSWWLLAHVGLLPDEWVFATRCRRCCDHHGDADQQVTHVPWDRHGHSNNQALINSW